MRAHGHRADSFPDDLGDLLKRLLFQIAQHNQRLLVRLQAAQGGRELHEDLVARQGALRLLRFLEHQRRELLQRP